MIFTVVGCALLEPESFSVYRCGDLDSLNVVVHPRVGRGADAGAEGWEGSSQWLGASAPQDSVGGLRSAGILLHRDGLLCCIRGADGYRHLEGIRRRVVKAEVVHREVIRRTGVVEVGNALAA